MEWNIPPKKKKHIGRKQKNAGPHAVD